MVYSSARPPGRLGTVVSRSKSPGGQTHVPVEFLSADNPKTEEEAP